MSGTRKPASTRIAAQNREALAGLPLEDQEDFDDARRGLIAPFEPAVVETGNGRTAWELESYGFLEDDPPDTAHPSLWRQSRLSRIAGLFELAPGIYQLRGFDLSNMHVIEGEQGIVVLDPLISAETAATALALYRKHRGERPVTGLIYTHSHVDHFGGAKGIVSQEEIDTREIPVLAPAGFLHHAVSENVFAGTAMGRRAGYMYGALLQRGPDGQIGSGLGQTTSLGTITLIPPTVEVSRTGQEEVVDGVRMVFQLTPGTEAPAEMNIHLPDRKALCIADNAARAMHNILTPRGALVRDPRIWAHYLDEAIELFGRDSDVLFGGHHWPCWGSERIVDYLEKQRDLYSYLHDQTLRLLNRGYTGPEIAELVELPPSLAREWHCREYYGSISHNVKAIYQRYMGWFDGNPAHLWEHPPAEQARRYVEFMGGAEAVLAKARESFDAGDYRWVAEVVNHVVFAEPENRAARELQADTLEQLGYGAENATWRNFFLMGARELREGIAGTPTAAAPPDIVANLSVAQLLDAMAIRLDGPRAWETRLRIDWVITDPGEEHAIALQNGVLRHRPGRHAPEADATLVIEREALDQVLLQTADLGELAEKGRLRVEGDAVKLGELLSLLDEPDPGFPIVTPRATLPATAADSGRLQAESD
ncbi:MAG: alkyl sulfatase dimerization domain-containing protein [Solirubrobacterales bacterium]